LETMARSHDAVGHAKIMCTSRRNKFLRRGAFQRIVRRLKAKVMREMEHWERQEARRVLTDSGVLSVYPKHVAEDGPADHFKDMSAKEVIREIRASGFSFRDKICGRLSHDDTLVSGCVWNFIKAVDAS